MEEPLPAGGSCLLGSINLSKFVIEPFTKNARINWDDLENTTILAVMALNQVLIEGLTLHPLKIQQDTVRDLRQIGLGTMGLGDMLIQLGLTYGSKESLDLIESVYKTIASVSVEESLALAKELGCYPVCDKEKLVQTDFIKTLDLPVAIIDDIRKYGLYNSQILTCAPTGSIGTMFETSTGVEPFFALSYTRKTQSLHGVDTYYQVDSKIVEEYKNKTGESQLPEYFVTSGNINPIDRVKVQSVLQKYTDASISSTVNLANEATIDDVYNIYMSAWENKLKGITIYRSGCKREGILVADKPSSETESSDNLEPINNTSELKRGDIIKVNNNCIGLKRTLTTGCGSLHCTAYFDKNNGNLLETYLSKGSQGGCQNFMVGLSRMVSLASRGGINIYDIVDQLKSCGTCPSYAVRRATKKDTSIGSCCPVAVGNALLDMHKEMAIMLQNNTFNNDSIEAAIVVHKCEESNNIYSECPECHEKTLVHDGGCTQCLSCGYSKCS